MIKFGEHMGVRYMIDMELDGLVQCRHLPPFTFKNAEECHAAIEARAALPTLEHTVHLGQTESHVYTRWAKDMFELQCQLASQFRSLKGEWVEVNVEPGYPTGTRKFQVRWPNNTHAPTPVMVVVRGVRN